MALNTEWVSVSTAATLMGLCKRQALRRLQRLDGEVGGRLLRALGDKQMPRWRQASKYLVSTAVLREALRGGGGASELQRDFERLRLEQLLTAEKVEALRRLIGPLLRRARAKNGT